MSNETKTALAVRESGVSGGMRLSGLDDVMKLANVLADAPGFTKGNLLGKPYSIVAAILTGMEMGLGPMESMRSIHSVDGKPALSAELMLAQARKNGARTRWVKTDATIATIAVLAPGETEWQTMSFTIEEARQAGLAGKDNWKKGAPAMLRARCTSAAIRAFCPETLGATGVYESDSGELTGGVPTEQVVEAQIVSTAKEPAKAAPQKARSLAECSTAVELEEGLRAGADKMRQSEGPARARFVAAITKHAARLEVPTAVALAWAGLGPWPADVATGEVVDDDAAERAAMRAEGLDPDA